MTINLTEGFTFSEKKVLELIVLGKANHEIADILHISLSTVKTHVHNILSKTGINDRKLLIVEFFDGYQKNQSKD
jgi:DNA-binding NarL/FixJ family response regulator